MRRAMTNKIWTVWVGGVEINDYYMTHARALEVAEDWREQGYDDVAIENHELRESNG
jgi:hypothetical protein